MSKKMEYSNKEIKGMVRRLRERFEADLEVMYDQDGVMVWLDIRKPGSQFSEMRFTGLSKRHWRDAPNYLLGYEIATGRLFKRLALYALSRGLMALDFKEKRYESDPTAKKKSFTLTGEPGPAGIQAGNNSSGIQPENIYGKSAEEWEARVKNAT